MCATSKTLSPSDFAALAEQSLVLEIAPGQSVRVQLSPVRSLGWNRPAAAGGLESFQFTLTAATENRLTQGCYALQHPTLGRLELFLVPIGRNTRGLVLEAIFNFA